MDYTISREVNTDRLYAYAKNRFWCWNESMHDWKESHLMSQTYEKAHAADARFSPEDFMSDGSRFFPLEDFEVDYLMRMALKNAEPCKTVPVEPVKEVATTQEAVAKCDDLPPATPDVPFDFSSLGDLSGQASEADAQFDLHYGAAQDEYLISCIYLAKIHALTAKAGRYGGGTWTKWYESKGISEGSARNMVKNGEAFKSSTIDELKQLPELTRKDLNMIARSGCAEQLTEAAGDSQRVQELLAQLKAAQADVSGLHEQNSKLKEQAYNANEDRIAARLQCQKAEARAQDAEKQLEGSRQVAKAATARAEKYKAEAEAARKQPIEAVVDEAEVERRANQIAQDIAKDLAADMTADLRARMEQDASGSQQDARDAYDGILLAERNIQNSWKMAKPLFAKLPAEQRETLINGFVRSLGQMQGEVSRCL